LGFNELKVIELAHLLRAIMGEERAHLSFEEGLDIERVVHAIARSAKAGRWVDVG
jgi:predicted dehydrogenase